MAFAWKHQPQISKIRSIKLLLCLILNVVISNDAARILAMIPTPSISHQVVFRPFLQELAKRGHEVVVITTDTAFSKEKAPANLTEIDIHDIAYKVWRESFLRMVSVKKDDFVTQMTLINNVFLEVFEKEIQSEEVQKILKHKSTGFDLLILEACARLTLGLSHIFKAPVIQMSSLGPIIGNHKVIGAPPHPLLYPVSTRQRLYNLTWWDVINELYNHIPIQSIVDSSEIRENEILKKLFGPDIAAINELSNRVDMLFLYIHPIWEGNQPVPPGLVYTRGLHQKPQKELPQDLKSYLDSSVNGVIYTSFGTNTISSMFPPEKVQSFVRVFSKLPYDILWKWDKDEQPERSKNIRIGKWFPQSDLLRHPKIKLFVTQGGLQSTAEALTAGVPLLGIPMLADQWYNVEKYVHHKIGLQLDLETLTDEKFETAINTIINDDSYRRNIVALNALMRDEPQRPLERAVWWTEHMLRHGGARHLRAPAANMSWWEYLELDLVLISLLVLSMVLLVLLNVLYFIFKYLKKLLQY